MHTLVNEPHLIRWLWAGVALCGSLALGYLFRTVAASAIERWFAKTETKLDDIAWSAVRPYLPGWFFLVGLVFAARLAPIPSSLYHHIDRGVTALAVVSVSLALARLLTRLLQTYARGLGIQAPSSSLMENLLRIAILTLGILLLLSNLGISITPLLTALGVGSLAVALALQDTLTNLFAGFYMLLNRQIEVGDWIKLDSGQEGKIHDIGLRSTGLKDPSNNMVLIPNAKLAQAIVTNYSLGEKEMVVTVQAAAAYDSDLAVIERLALEEARQVQKTLPGAVSTFEPVVVFHTLAESSVNFVVVMYAKDYSQQGPIRHDFIKRLHARFKAEGIRFPVPQREVAMRGLSPA